MIPAGPAPAACPGPTRARAAGLALLSILLACACLSVAAAPPLEPFAMQYEVRHNGMLLARMERTLRRDGDGSYIIESRSTPAGMLSALMSDHVLERSEWAYAGDRPRPIRYEYRHTGRGDERHVVLDFDWDKGAVTNTVNDDPWQMKIPDDTQDKLLYQYTMMLDLQEGQEGLRDLQYHVADGGELKTYRYAILGRETLETAIGRLETVRLERVLGKRRTVVWCATGLGYLPVRLEQYRDRRMVVVTVAELKRGE